MLFRESETVELKEVVVDDIKKEIIAFANCDGGKLYIGSGTMARLSDWIMRIVFPFKSAIW